MKTFEFEAADGAKMAGVAWPTSAPRAMVQISHGMGEHVRRYDRLARALNAAGYAVVGADHRGHGDNHALHGLGDFGPRGFAGVVEDMASLTAAARTRFPGAPVVLLGHSMGSFSAQAYLLGHGEGLAALVLSGTALLEQLLASRSGGGGLQSNNVAFEPARTPFDWLSRDEAEVDAYIADPMCGFDLQPESLGTIGATVFGSMSDVRMTAAAARDLPIYVISGEFDPIVGPGQTFAQALVDGYRAAGFSDVAHRVYSGGRHEMFNETNRDEVQAELIAWLDRHVGRGA